MNGRHVEIWIGAENDTSAFPNNNYKGGTTYNKTDKTGMLIYSCGLEKKASVASDIYAVLRPKFGAGTGNTSSNSSISTTSNSSVQPKVENAAEKLLTSAGNYVQNEVYGKNLVYGKNDNSHKIDCEKYVRRVLEAYGKEHGVVFETGGSDILPRAPIYWYSAIKNNKEIISRNFETVYIADNERQNNLAEKGKEWIENNLQPGDILIYTRYANQANEQNGHIDIFAGFGDATSDTNTINVKIYSCGWDPMKHGGTAWRDYYSKGLPFEQAYSLTGNSSGGVTSHSFYDVTAVLRLK